MSKRSISAKALVADIKNGISDPELMSRHELSYGQLQKILAQLVKAGYVTQEVLDGRMPQDAETSSTEARGTNVNAAGAEASSEASPQEDRKPEGPKPSSSSLPLSREEAARFRSRGLILILGSYGLWIIGTIVINLAERAEPDSFLQGEFIAVLVFLSMIGWLVTSILGCLWRARGLGQHPVWAIVAPLCGLNIIVMAALPNRYEPESDHRGFWLIFAVLALLVSMTISSLMIKNLMGL